jgi:heme/copper-type cytochrome/quinol oxidase subunit 3
MIESPAAARSAEPLDVPADSSAAVARPLRAVLDVRDLPSVVFGSRVVTWWGTLAFMVAETATLAACLAAYFYVRRGFSTWPPPRTPNPDLLLPTINLAILLVALVPNYLYARAAKRLDTERAKRWMWIAVATMSLATVLRLFEFDALNVRWDTNAYASVAWTIVFAHFTLLLIDTIETLLFAIIVTRGAPDRYYPGVDEDGFYSYFMIIAWIPCYVTVYLVPRWT